MSDILKYENLLFKKDKGIASLTLNRPEKLNAINRKTLDELEDCLHRIARDEEVKVVVLSGSGRGFCSGFNLSEGIDPENAIPSARRVMAQITSIILSLKNIPKLFIAAVNGPAIGLGFGLVLAADMSIAADNALFSAPFVLRGLHTDTATTYFLPKIVGLTRARELLLTGKTVNAREAETLGIVNRVVSPEQLQSEVSKLAQQWAEGPQIALTMSKSSIYEMLALDLSAALELEARAQCECFATEDAKEAFRAWQEKRQPRFKGR